MLLSTRVEILLPMVGSCIIIIHQLTVTFPDEAAELCEALANVSASVKSTVTVKTTPSIRSPRGAEVVHFDAVPDGTTMIDFNKYQVVSHHEEQKVVGTSSTVLGEKTKTRSVLHIQGKEYRSKKDALFFVEAKNKRDLAPAASLEQH